MTLKKVLVVGSWAKEQITIENISKNSEIDVFSWMDIRNPFILPLVKGYRIGSLYDTGAIADYALDEKIDLVIITTALPLSGGLVDDLRSNNILAFGPDRIAAQLESNKEFTRRLLQEYLPSAIPSFEVFDDPDKAISYSQELDWKVAVKPIGLTEGLGVKVAGDQLTDENDVRDYIRMIIKRSISGSSRVIIEEKLIGEEFTIQCFVHGDVFIPTPAVQDFKKLLPGEKGPNTASMGSYSQKGHLLPFMKEEDYAAALDIIRGTLDAFKKKTGRSASGFLYGQFMLTADGVKLIEYNFRPGDPEWLNTVMVLKNNILDIIIGLFQGKKHDLVFEKSATVCKYIVPQGYPQTLHQILNVDFDREELQKIEGLKIYSSVGLDDHGRLNTGAERGLAFIAKAPTIAEANGKVEQVISMVRGSFYYRPDIGTSELIDSKIEHAARLRGF